MFQIIKVLSALTSLSPALHPEFPLCNVDSSVCTVGPPTTGWGLPWCVCRSWGQATLAVGVLHGLRRWGRSQLGRTLWLLRSVCALWVFGAQTSLLVSPLVHQLPRAVMQGATYIVTICWTSNTLCVVACKMKIQNPVGRKLEVISSSRQER